MKYMYALSNTTTYHNQRRVQLHRGEAWDASDPFVKANQHLFADQPPVVRTVDGPVEQATAAPGEKRRTRRG